MLRYILLTNQYLCIIIAPDVLSLDEDAGDSGTTYHVLECRLDLRAISCNTV